MDFSPTHEQRLMMDSAKRLSESVIEPILASCDKTKPLPKPEALTILRHAAELGVIAARVPEESGGGGLKILDYGLIIEQLPVVAGLLIQTQETAIARIYSGSTEEQRERFLPDLISGRKITCTATTEPDSGSDNRGIKTTVTPDGDDVIVNGRKSWISNASICDLVNVTARASRHDGEYELVRVLVDRETSPFTTTETDVIGLQQSHLGEFVFEDCRVPKENCYGQAGDAARILTMTWLSNRPLLGLAAVHLAQKAFERAKDYAGLRKQFGRAIGAFQIVQEDLAEIETAITASRLLCYNALAAIDRGERANGLSAMAKRFAVDSCDKAIALAMRIHGAMGLSRELGLEQLARDVRMLSIPDGTPGILSLIQGREITGIDPFRQ